MSLSWTHHYLHDHHLHHWHPHPSPFSSSSSLYLHHHQLQHVPCEHYCGSFSRDGAEVGWHLSFILTLFSSCCLFRCCLTWQAWWHSLVWMLVEGVRDSFFIASYLLSFPMSFSIFILLYYWVMDCMSMQVVTQLEGGYNPCLCEVLVTPSFMHTKLPAPISNGAFVCHLLLLLLQYPAG